MTPSHVTEVVQVHREAFQGFFLSVLGPWFLREYYRSLLSGPSGFAFVSWDGPTMTGFVVGTDQPRGMYRRLLRKRWWKFGLASVPALARHPSLIPRVAGWAVKSEHFAAAPGVGTLIQISVRPSIQGKGIGKALVEAFLAEARTRGLSEVNLTTDADGNDPVNAFYLRLGFARSRAFTTREGRRMNEYTIRV